MAVSGAYIFNVQKPDAQTAHSHHKSNSWKRRHSAGQKRGSDYNDAPQAQTDFLMTPAIFAEFTVSNFKKVENGCIDRIVINLRLTECAGIQLSNVPGAVSHS
jgi:hypothetical protein